MSKKIVASPFSVLPLSEFLAKDYGVETVISKGLLDLKGMMVVEGPTEIGKSYLVHQIAFDIASGRPILGEWAVERPFNVLLVQAENSPKRFQSRTAKLGRNYDNPGGRFRVDTHYHLKIDTPEGFEVLDKTLSEHNIEVLILDPLRAFHQGDENSPQDVDRLFGQLKLFGENHNIAIIFTHHEPSGGEYSLIMERPDTILKLSPIGKDRLKVKLTFDRLRNGEGIGGAMELVVDGESGLFMPAFDMSE